MQASCPKCGYVIPPEEVQPRTTCAKCGAVFDPSRPAPAPKPAAPARRDDVLRPENIRLEQDGPDLVISYRWFTVWILILVPFCIFWDSIVGTLFASLLRGKNVPVFAFVFPLPHLCIGLGLTYYLLARLLNKTEIRVSPSQLSIWHGPLPWLGNRTVRREDIEQLFCEQRMRTGKRGTVFYSYRVMAATRSGMRIELVRGLQSPEEAWYIEQEIESRFGIPNRRMPGEFRAWSDPTFGFLGGWPTKPPPSRG